MLIHALETASASQKAQISGLLQSNEPGKVEQMLSVFRACGVDEWARELKDRYMAEALNDLEDVAVLSKRKEPLKELALFLTQRQH